MSEICKNKNWVDRDIMQIKQLVGNEYNEIT